MSIIAQDALTAQVKTKAPYLVVVAAAFLVQELYLFINGLLGDCLKYQSVAAGLS
jgi:hypothetical protein